MYICSPVRFYFEWSALVFEFYVPSFWSYSFRFAQTEGTLHRLKYDIEYRNIR